MTTNIKPPKFKKGDVVFGDWNNNGRFTRHTITDVKLVSHCQSGILYQCKPDLNPKTWGSWYDEGWFVSEAEHLKQFDDELPW